jgi:hypothetical protein
MLKVTLVQRDLGRHRTTGAILSLDGRACAVNPDADWFDRAVPRDR